MVKLIANKPQMIQLYNTTQENSGSRVARIGDQHVGAEAVYNAIECVLHGAGCIKMATMANGMLRSEHYVYSIGAHIPMEFISIASYLTKSNAYKRVPGVKRTASISHSSHVALSMSK